MSAAVRDDRLATPKEQELIARLRERFKDELSAREAAGRAPPCLFGELALLRVLRGNDADLDTAEAWFKRFLKLADACKVDEMEKRMAKIWDEAGTPTPLDGMLPYHDEVKEHVRAVFTAPKFSPEGDLINYISFANFDMWKMANPQRLDWSHWVEYMQGATVMRLIECDRQSRAQRRLVKAITVIDIKGASVFRMNCPKFHVANRRDVGNFQEGIAAEIFGSVYILNTPYVLQRLYAHISRFIPERFRKKVTLLSGDGTEDPSFVMKIGGQEQLKQLLAVRESLFDDAAGTKRPLMQQSQVIAARREFVKSVDLTPGQQLSWSFAVAEGGDGGALLSEADVDFSVHVLWTEAWCAQGARQPPRPFENHLASMAPEVIVAPRRVSASQGKTEGSFLVQRPGVAFLRWDNCHSMLRHKSIRFSVDVAVVRSDEVLRNGTSKARTSTILDGFTCCGPRPQA